MDSQRPHITITYGYGAGSRRVSPTGQSVGIDGEVANAPASVKLSGYGIGNCEKGGGVPAKFGGACDDGSDIY